MVNSIALRTYWALGRAKKTPDIGSTKKRLERVRAIVLIIVTFIAVGILGCSKKYGRDSEQVQGMSHKTIEQVQEEYTSQWMAILGVEGTAIGLFEGKPCIKIFSSKKAEELREKIPAIVDGYPVVIEETGTFRALDQQ